MFIVHLSKNINLLNLVVTLFWTAVPLTDKCATVLQRAGCVTERMGCVLKMVVAILKSFGLTKEKQTHWFLQSAMKWLRQEQELFLRF